MAKLSELASTVRSKNAGVNQITFDIIFGDEDVYREVKASEALTAPARTRKSDKMRDLGETASVVLILQSEVPRPIFWISTFVASRRSGEIRFSATRAFKRFSPKYGSSSTEIPRRFAHRVTWSRLSAA